MIGVSGKTEKDHAALEVLVHLHKNLKEFMTFEIHWLYTSLCFNHKNFKVAGGIFPCQHNVRIYLLWDLFEVFCQSRTGQQAPCQSLSCLFGISSVRKRRQLETFSSTPTQWLAFMTTESFYIITEGVKYVLCHTTLHPGHGLALGSSDLLAASPTPLHPPTPGPGPLHLHSALVARP